MLGSIDSGARITQENLEGFNNLKRYKKGDVRIIAERSKGNEPEKIIAIIPRKDLEDLLKVFKKNMIKFTNIVIKDIRLLNQIEDEFKGNVDVAVELKDGYSYVIYVSTSADLLEKMEIEKRNFVPPYSPRIIVKKLSKEIITEAIQAYAQNDGYWLKLCQFGDELISVLNKLEAQHREELEFFELGGLDRLFYYIQKYLKVPSDNRVLIEPMFFLILVSLIAYCLFEPRLLDFFSNFIH